MKKSIALMITMLMFLSIANVMAYDFAGTSNATMLSEMKMWDTTTWKDNMADLAATQDAKLIKRVIVIAEKAMNGSKVAKPAQIAAALKTIQLNSLGVFVIGHAGSGYTIGLNEGAFDEVDTSITTTIPANTVPGVKVPTSTVDVVVPSLSKSTTIVE